VLYTVTPNDDEDLPFVPRALILSDAATVRMEMLGGGAVIDVRQAYLVVGVVGMPLAGHTLPWMDGLFGFVQVDDKGLPVAFPGQVEKVGEATFWEPLRSRLEKLARIRGATAEWMATA
jgi:hypothetical protein